ncbi:MAG: hypothetical protein ACRD2T_03190 [Thermoanaerobaculia bacterium]
MKPIVRGVPYGLNAEPLTIRKPRSDAPKLQEVPLPPPLDLGFDIVDLLLEERAGGRKSRPPLM